MNSKKNKSILVFFLCSVVVFLIMYKIFLYTPPLFDQGKRNIAEKTLDFFCFGWYLTRGSIVRDYWGDRGKANEDLAKAGWHRKKYLLNRFVVKEEDLSHFLEENKNQDKKIIREKLYVFLMTPKNR